MDNKGVDDKRNNFIDMLRFVFAILIALFHIVGAYPLVISEKINLFVQGAIGVEFFSIVSGFLMAKSAWRRIKEPTDTLGKETVYYVGKKYIRIFPYHFWAFMISLILYLLWDSLSLFDGIRVIFFSFSDLFMLNMTGLFSLGLNVPAWYLSSMFISLLILYPIIRGKYDLFVHVFAPLFVLFSIGWMSHTTECMRGITAWYGIMYKGTIRVAIGIALGSICFEICQAIQSKEFSIKLKRVLSVIEVGGYVLTILYSCLDLSEQGYFIMLFVIATSVTLTFSRITITKKFGKDIKGLEKLSLSIFLNQTYCAKIINYIVSRYNIIIDNIGIVTIYLLFTIASSIVCVAVVDTVKRKYMKIC